LQLQTGKPNLEVFSQTLVDLARDNDRLYVVCSDSRGSGKLVPFAEALPDRVIEVGIAEQNLVGISAGLASTGKHVFAVSPACFLTARALEQIKNDVCYSDNPVKLIGISAGVSYGALGSTHHSLHDIAALRAIHNIDLIIPADNFETQAAIRAAIELPNPVYIRFGKRPMPHLHRTGETFIVGKAIRIREGTDLAFLASGETVYHAVLAAMELEKLGINAGVTSVHTVKPLDQSAVLHAAESCGHVITVEEHSVNGGLGEACAGLLLQHGLPVKYKIVGIPDEYTVTGSQPEIFKHYGISAEGLKQSALQLLNR
jgi:transketolase